VVAFDDDGQPLAVGHRGVEHLDQLTGAGLAGAGEGRRGRRGIEARLQQVVTAGAQGGDGGWCWCGAHHGDSNRYRSHTGCLVVRILRGIASALFRP